MDARCHIAAPCVTARVDRLCDRFEKEWKAGAEPSIEDYLVQVDRSERETLGRELIALDLEYRGRRGELPPRSLYRQRFPAHARLIDELWIRGALAGSSRSAGPSPRGGLETAAPTVCFSMEPSRPLPRESSLVGPAVATGAADHLDQLRRIWPFSELAAGVVRQIAAAAVQQRYEAGEVLLRQGEPCPSLLVLLEGTVDVQVEDRGKRHAIAAVRTAAVLGEMSLLGHSPCTASVIAAGPVRVLSIPRSELERLASEQPVIWNALGGLIAGRLGHDSVDALVGKVVGGYRILRCAGRGGMAVVYEAEEPQTGRRVALKMMSHRYVNDLELHSRFQREAEIGLRLRHPNICRVEQTFSALGTQFMVMEFCDGTTLDQYVRQRGRLRQEEVRRILGQLAAALAYAHRHGICHRDLKPANVMLDPNGCVKLADFGLARTAESSEMTGHGRLVGTPRYMPPEQLAGEVVDYRADVYAFGCIAFEMLAGRPLMVESDLLAILDRHARWSLPPADSIRPRLSSDLYGVLRESLAKEPHARTLDLDRLSRRWNVEKRSKKSSQPLSAGRSA